MNSGQKNIPILLGLLVGGLLIASFFFSADTSMNHAGVVSANKTTLFAATAPSGRLITAAEIAVSAPPPPDYVTYHNDTFGFSFSHSPQGIVREYDEGGGATTIVLENVQRVRGFQVFIVPYTGTTISEEQFRRDIPSGVRTNVEHTTLDGVEAVTFISYDDVLGDTREIWFIRNGYLYEITTIKGTANWFAPVIQTWRFI